MGANSLTYTVKDDDGVISNEATVNIGVASGFTLTAGDDVFIADQKGYATALRSMAERATITSRPATSLAVRVCMPTRSTAAKGTT